jgi:putative flippase GtrA
MLHIARRALWWLQSSQGVKYTRYFLGSVITTVISFLTLTILYGVVHRWGAVTCTVIANVVATIPAYWLNRTWTWGKTGKSDTWREVVPFWVASLAGIAISMVTAAWAADLARAHHLHRLGQTVLVDGANLAAYGVLFIGKYLLFERLFLAAERRRRAGADDLRAGSVPEGLAPVAPAARTALASGPAPSDTLPLEEAVTASVD